MVSFKEQTDQEELSLIYKLTGSMYVVLLSSFAKDKVELFESDQ